MRAHEDRLKDEDGQTRQPTMEEYKDMLRETLLSAGMDASICDHIA